MNEKENETYQQLILNQYPVELPVPEIWTFNKIEFPKLNENEYLIKIEYLSVDPYMRGRMRKGNPNGFKLNQEITCLAVGKVVKSNKKDVNVGEYYTGYMSISEYYLVKPNDQFRKIDDKLPLHYYISILGMTGLFLNINKGATAYQVYF
jgi:NADPH-dependent curcumin reductase CurA